MSAVNPTTFYETIKLSFLLSPLCLMKCVMKQKQIWRWKHQKWVVGKEPLHHLMVFGGKFSQNCTFMVRNYTNNSLRYSKRCWGTSSRNCILQSQRRGVHIEVQWQNGDSLSAKAFREHFPDEEKSKGGHMARAPTNYLVNMLNRNHFLPPCRMPTRRIFLL